MKQSSGWNKASSKSTFNKTNRRVNGGGYSLKYASKRPPTNKAFKTNALFETIKERLNFTLKSLAGKTVVLKKENGVILEGILIASEGESFAGKGITLCYVKVTSKPDKVKENYSLGPGKVYIKWNDLVYIQGKDSTDVPIKPDKFKTDTDITRKNIMQGNIAGRTLQAADPSWVNKNGNTKEVLETGNSGGAWDQFKVNEEKFGVKGTYDENLYTTKLDKSKLTEEQIEKAKQTAKEIENKSTSNIHRKEERNQKVESSLDEEAKYSAVARSPSKQVSSKPLSYSDILMKGKLEAASKAEAEKEASATKTPKHTSKKAVEGLTTPIPVDGKVGVKEKYKVSDVDFSAYKKAAQAKIAIHTPSSKNWPAHDLTRKKLEGVNKKSRDEQIKEFKNFSSRLDAKKKDTKKQLNVNAKEFKPPGGVTYPPPQMFPPQVQEVQNAATENSAQQANAATNMHGAPAVAKPPGAPNQQNQGGNTAQTQGQGYIPQQNFWPVGMSPVPAAGVNFVHPAVVLPPGAQHYPVYPQAPNGNPIFIPQGAHPYFVQMMPGAAIQPGYGHQQQSQRFAAGFHQPVMQVVPQQVAANQGSETDAQKIGKVKQPPAMPPPSTQNKHQQKTGGGARFNHPPR